MIFMDKIQSLEHILCIIFLLILLSQVPIEGYIFTLIFFTLKKGKKNLTRLFPAEVVHNVSQGMEEVRIAVALGNYIPLTWIDPRSTSSPS